MRNASPLRYPGGKAAMASLLRQVRKLNSLGSCAIAEPFAGGAGASLALLYSEESNEIHINDADRAIFDFWWSLTHRHRQFLDLIMNVDVTIDEWYRQRSIYRSAKRVSRLCRGFAAFYLNRCNRSGIIINGGPIGGVEQAGKWKLDARFNKEELRSRCKKVAEYRDRIHVSCRDGIDFIASFQPESTFFFIDPPYFGKGRMLYMDALEDNYHAKLAAYLRATTSLSWVLTYDDCPEIRNLYEGWASVRPFGLRYAAAERREGKELLITPKWMQLPPSQTSTAIAW